MAAGLCRPEKRWEVWTPARPPRPAPPFAWGSFMLFAAQYPKLQSFTVRHVRHSRRDADPLQLVLLRLARGRRPRNRARGRARTRSAARRNRADRLGKHRLARRAGGAGFGADQQIRRGLSRPALLRRLPVRRHRRNAGDRARLQAVRLPFANVQPNSGSQANQGVFLALLQPGDVVHGARSRRRRPSDARLAGQHVRAAGSSRSPMPSIGKRIASTWTRSRRSRASTSRS